VVFGFVGGFVVCNLYVGLSFYFGFGLFRVVLSCGVLFWMVLWRCVGMVGRSFVVGVWVCVLLLLLLCLCIGRC